MLLAALLSGAISFCGSYSHNSWSEFDNIWWSAFNPDAPQSWYHMLGMLTNCLFFSSIALLLFGEIARRIVKVAVNWVREGA
jgi:hypothetical protein